MSVIVDPDDWLALELDRIWLHAEVCLHELQAAGLRPAATGDLGMILAARGARSVGASGVAIEDRLARATADVMAVRAYSPIAHLGRLAAETLVLAIAPHIDPVLAELFAAVRGARRPVDLALVIQLFQLARADRIALLAVLDPEATLVADLWIEIGPLDRLAASATSRAIYPTFHALALLAGRVASTPGPDAPELACYAD